MLDPPPPMAAVRRQTVGGAAYAEWGTGEPLLLIHGVGMRLEAWLPQAQALSRSFRVIAVDMPGHGESERLPENARLPEFVAWFRSVLDHLELTRVNVAGHSMGALVAGGLAATLGERVARVALLNGVFRRSAAARQAVLARADAIRAGDLDPTGPLARWFGEDDRDTEPFKLAQQWLSNVDPSGYATAYQAFAEGDALYADAWPRITAPALFLTGEHDPNSTPAMAEEMADRAPEGRAHVVKGHRHMVNLTAPGLVNAALAEWLARPVRP